MLMCKKVCFLLFLFLSNFVFSQDTQSTIWVDSIMITMSPEERIAQLLMVATYSNKDKSHTTYISNLIKNYKIVVCTECILSFFLCAIQNQGRV